VSHGALISPQLSYKTDLSIRRGLPLAPVVPTGPPGRHTRPRVWTPTPVIVLQCCVESGTAGSIREYQESRSGMGVSGVPDIRESGPTGHPGYLRDIRDIRNQDHWQGWGYQVLSLISLIQHSCNEAQALFAFSFSIKKRDDADCALTSSTSSARGCDCRVKEAHRSSREAVSASYQRQPQKGVTIHSLASGPRPNFKFRSAPTQRAARGGGPGSGRRWPGPGPLAPLSTVRARYCYCTAEHGGNAAAVPQQHRSDLDNIIISYPLPLAVTMATSKELEQKKV
jgi:hypothetical protein